MSNSSKNSCFEAKAALNEITTLKADFTRELDTAAETGDFKRAREIKSQLESALAELQEKIDPWQYRLRDRIAKENGLVRVGKFNDGNVAIATVYESKKSIVPDGFLIPPREEPRENYFWIDKSGQQISDTFKTVFNPSEGIYPCQRFDDSWTFVDENGKEVGKHRFTKINSFSEGLAWVVEEGSDEWSVLSSNTRKTIPITGCRIHDHDPGFFREGFAKISLTTILTPTRQLEDFFLSLNDKANIHSDRKISERFESATDFNEGLAFVVPRNATTGHFIDQNGKMAIAEEFKNATVFSGGVAAVQKADDLWHYIDKTGKPAFHGELEFYKEAEAFENGTAVVKLRSGKYTIIDKTGKELVGEYEEIEHNFKDGVAVVVDRSKPGTPQHLLLDKNGHIITAVTQGYISEPSDGFSLARNDDGYYYVDIKRKRSFIGILDNEQFDDAAPFHEGVAEVAKNGETYYIDRKGRRIFS